MRAHPFFADLSSKKYETRVAIVLPKYLFLRLCCTSQIMFAQRPRPALHFFDPAHYYYTTVLYSVATSREQSGRRSSLLLPSRRITELIEDDLARKRRFDTGVDNTVAINNTIAVDVHRFFCHAFKEVMVLDRW
jgi:hypothetical protein